MSTETLLKNLPAGLAGREGPAAVRAFLPPGRDASTIQAAAVQPMDTAGIRALVQWAKRHDRKLVPVSSAQGPRRNGGSVPGGSSVVVDLSQMKRVRHIDGKDAIAVIEPGVTYPEFDAQLANHGLRSFKPLLPRRSKSVLASYLEREPITSPREQWDGSDPLACVEMVFGTGEQFRTGSAGSADELEVQLQHGLRQMFGPGPFATDFTRVAMGSQGTLGIVSWGSVYCERIPALEQAFFVPSDSLERLVKLSARIGWRKLAAQTFIVNNVQLALLFGGDRDSVLRLVERLPRWTLFVNIAAPHYFAEDRIAFETEALQEDARSFGLEVHQRLHGQAADSITAMQQQLPEQHYKDRLGADVDEIFFLSQTDKAAPFIDAFQALHASSGSTLPYGVYLQPRVQGSSCHVEFTSFWERSADQQARTAFHRKASQAMGERGAYFSRPYGVWKDIAYSRDPHIVPYLRQVKAMFDPKGVLNPGK
jgi:FAD/FMN-containing dehydrogenase